MDEEPRHRGLTLEDHAALSARIADGAPLAQILAERSVSEEDWNAATIAWTNALARDVRENGVEATLAIRYSEAFVAAQTALRPAPELTVEEWAELQYRVETRDREQILAARGLRLSDYLRLVRLWAARLASDRVIASRHRAALDALHTRE